MAQFWSLVIILALTPAFIIFTVHVLAQLVEPLLVLAGLVCVVRLIVWALRGGLYRRDEW